MWWVYKCDVYHETLNHLKHSWRISLALATFNFPAKSCTTKYTFFLLAIKTQEFLPKFPLLSQLKKTLNLIWKSMGKHSKEKRTLGFFLWGWGKVHQKPSWDVLGRCTFLWNNTTPAMV